MTLKEQIADDIETVFLNTDDFAVEITYQRGALTSNTIAAMVSQTTFDKGTEFGFTRVETRDYLFPPSRLVLNSSVQLPAKGDRIIEDGRTYTVTNGPDNELYGYDDEDRLLLRVHTVLTQDA